MDEAQTVEAALSAVRKLVPPLLIDRLKYLHSFDVPPVRNRDPMAYASLRHTLTFWLRNQELPHPRITVTPAGHILFEWPRSLYRYAAIDFLDDDCAEYFLLIQGEERTRGRSTIHKIVDKVSPKTRREWYHVSKKHSVAGSGASG